MKNLILISIWCLLLACGSQTPDRELVISGEIIPGETLMLLQNRDGRFKEMAVTKADSTGHFRLEYLPSQMELYLLTSKVSSKSIPLMGQPGEKIEIDLTGKEPVFTGDAVERNTFLQEFKEKKNGWAQQWQPSYDDFSVFCQMKRKYYDACRDYLKGAGIKDKEVTGILENDAMVEYYSALLKFPFVYQLIKGETIVLPDESYSFLAEVDLSSPYLNHLGNTNSFLQEMFTVMEGRGYLQAGEEDYLLKRAGLISDPLVREKYLLYTINAVELRGYNQHLGKQLEGIMPLIITPEGQAEFEVITAKYRELAEQNGRFNAGQPAADFEGTDARGKKHRLSDYKGKVVVLDVWNTGCKPCIGEIPWLEKLEKQFEGEDVVFISYSLENNTEVWKQFLTAHEMGGNQWINTEAFKSAFAKAYNVRSIPRFMVFGKDGNIVEVYAPRPSNPRLARLIRKELNK